MQPLDCAGAQFDLTRFRAVFGAIVDARRALIRCSLRDACAP